MCLECVKSCNHEKGVHIYLKTEEMSTSDLITLLQAVLLREHNIVIQEIIFFKSGSLKYTKDGKPKRLYMREKLLKKQLGNEVTKVIQLNNECEETNDDLVLEDKYCRNCFGEFSDTLNQPLDLQNFEVLNEWKLEVPLPLQMFLEKSFINKKTLQYEPQSVYEEKIASLYCQLDALLNTLNKKYSGLTQDVNTDELLVNYHHTSTVFSITASSGISMSQKTGDRRLKEKAEDELCYYKTFVRKYPLLYQIADESYPDIHQVSMKDCHAILMIDNLVFLAQKSDPKPDEAKLNQICTLPITLKGIPKNSKELLEWHGNNCDMSSECECMLKVELLKDQIADTFFEQSVLEKSTFAKFNREAIWGLGTLWKDMIMKLSPQSDIDQLDRTMESLTLEESIDKDIQWHERNRDITEIRIENIGLSNSITEGHSKLVNEQTSALAINVGTHDSIPRNENSQMLHAHNSILTYDNETEQRQKETGDLQEQQQLRNLDFNSRINASSSNIGQCGIYSAYESILMENNEALQLETNETYQSCTDGLTVPYVKSDSDDLMMLSDQNDFHETADSEFENNCHPLVANVGKTQMATCSQHTFESMLSDNNDAVMLGLDTTQSPIHEQSSVLDSGLTPVAMSGSFSSFLLHEADSEDEDELGNLFEEVVRETQSHSLPEFTSALTDNEGSTSFQQFQTPKLLCRHPPPAAGRDDDISVLRNVLDDMLLKMEPEKHERILFAPDYKIAKNLFKLMDQNPKYQTFLPEFPVLHLRKSKITNLISAYRSSGLIHIIQFMKDQELEKDWSKLIGIANIETATRNVWRLSVALHIAFMLKFVDSLGLEERHQFEEKLTNDTVDTLDAQWTFHYDSL